MTKKLSLLFLICLLSALNINAEIYEGSCGDNVRYSLNTSTGVLKITGTGKMDYHAWNTTYVKSVVITNGVTSIPSSVFSGYSGIISVTIPQSVVSIGESAFYRCSGLKKVNITDIAAWCKINFVSGSNPLSYAKHLFIDGKEITDLVIPNSVTSIRARAFYGCSGLTSITIPNSVVSIGESAFYGCSSLNKVNITDIAAWCKIDFSNYDSNPLYCAEHLYIDGKEITDLVIPNSVISIGGLAFRNCSNLTSVTIPNSVTSIEESAFSGCYNLQLVKINSNEIVSKSYNSNASLTKVFGNQIKEYILGEDIKSIGSYAFSGSGLTSVTIPSSVTSIGSYAFSGCTGLKSVTIPSSVTSIGSYAFFGSGLTSVTIPNSVTSINGTFSGCSSLTSVTIPNSITSIGYDTFRECTSLSSIIIPNSVTSIGGNAFYGCSGLTSLTIPNSVTSIGSNIFSLKPIKVIWLTNSPPEGYKSAAGSVNFVANDQYSFDYGSTSIIYPFLSSMFEVNGIKYVPVSPSERTCDAIDCAFEETASTINLPSTVSYKGIEMKVKNAQPYLCYKNTNIEKVVCNISGAISNYAFSECSNLGKVELGSDITSIGNNAFSGCSKLGKVEMGSGITSIGNNAFSGCSKLESIIIPDAVTSLGLSVFSNCFNLNSIKIGNGVKTISINSFSGCSSLPKIQIPQSVTSIEGGAFSGCSGLKTVIMDNGDLDLSLSNDWSSPLFANCPLDSVYIGRNIIYNTSSNYIYSPFYRNTSLRTVVITDKETEISDNEFYGCTNLQNFKVGDGVTKFGKYAFSGCSSLKSLSFGAQLQSIGQEAFSDCNAVTTIVSKATTPPVCGSQALDDISKWECSLYVPEGTLSAYQAADQWKEFFFTAEGAEDIDPEEQDPTINKCATPTINIVDGKIKFASETEGAEFIYRITPSTALSGNDEEAPMLTKYTISVYAKKDGFIQSDEATKEIDLGTSGIRGDVNNDGEVGMPDAMFIVNKILNGKFPDE